MREITSTTTDKKNYKNTKAIVFMIFLIQMTERSISRDMRWSKEFILVVPLLVCVVLLAYMIIVKKRKINKKSFLFSCLITMSLFLTMLINQDFANDNFFIISTVLCGFSISNIFTRDEFFNAYTKAILFYSVFSLIATYLIHPLVMQGNFNFLPVYTNRLGTPFTDYGFAYVVRWMGFRRNQGYFTEPGVFQFFIFIAIIIEAIYFKRKNKLILVLLLATLISTFSTVAFIGLIPLVFIYILKCYKVSKREHIIIFAFIGITIYLLFTNQQIAEIVNYAVFEKFQGFGGGSFVVRFESVLNLLKSTFQKPLHGNSFVNGFRFIQENYTTYNTIDVTGTFFIFMMALGIPVGIIIIWNFIKLCQILTHNNRINMVAVFMVLFFSVNTQNLVYDLILMIFLFVPFMKRGNKYEEKFN